MPKSPKNPAAPRHTKSGLTPLGSRNGSGILAVIPRHRVDSQPRTPLLPEGALTANERDSHVGDNKLRGRQHGQTKATAVRTWA
ncbi:hypothetical protein M404DRAFT_1009398 [Pisolithus tinctorius Marx 270]|uniref:Uncharacterized protein n=1 Tax=Pisolithus tinctorius Marx 270 TaxID=870435 RepID=A0A0C3N9T0_PISTI|nr:hypothetical protein M404DRAFT_1009398 [Pisolithus tinctorius Marx 270]